MGEVVWSKNDSLKRRRSSVVVKFRKVSGTVWVCLKAMIAEKTLKEE